MTTLLGCTLWLLAGWALMAGLGERGLVRRPGPGRRALWVVLLVGAAVLLFRPEEEVTSGEDAGAYLNTAFSHARQGTLTLEDPALAELDPDRRPLFQFREGGYGRTKDLCFWIKDVQTARVGPWFHPAFPLLLSVPAALGFPYGAFWVAPIFAIMSAMLLAGLARRFTGKETMAVAAFVLYLLHPAMVWNARCLRAEIPAGFFLLCGITILTATSSGRARSFRAGLLAGLLFPVAILLHATAAYVTLPALLVAAWMTRRERFWGGWWCGWALGMAALIAQVMWVTDPYKLVSALTDPVRGPLLGGVALSFFLVLVAVLARTRLLRGLRAAKQVIVSRWGTVADRAGYEPRFSERTLGWIMALAYLLAVAWVFLMRDGLGNVPGLPAWLTAYLSLTDFRGVLSLSSIPWAITALAGLVALCSVSGERGTLGRRLFFMLGPAALTIGWMINYMFETRRTTLALVPLMVLATVALLDVIERGLSRFLPNVRAPARCVPCLGVILLVASACWGRAPLYQLWNRGGTFAFYRDLAHQVEQQGDFLFAEYTQTAAPIEHLTGLPLLPIAWEHRDDSDYRDVEAEIEKLVHAHPERRHLLVTPFAGAALPGLVLEPLFTRTLETRILERSKEPIPTTIHDQTLTMHVAGVSATRSTTHDTPYVRMMDGSRLGASGAANFMRRRSIETEGIPVGPGRPATLRMAAAEDLSGRPGRIAMVFAVPSGALPSTLAATRDGQTTGEDPYALCPGWQVLEIDRPSSTATHGEVQLTASERVYLTDLLPLDNPGPDTERWRELNDLETFRLDAFDSQWFRAQSALALPAMAGPGHVWVYATNGRDDGVPGTLTLQPAAEGHGPVEHPLRSRWRWCLMPIASSTGEAGIFAWHDLRVEQPWDSGLKDFPEDLGVRIHAVILRPRTGEKRP